MNQLLMRQILLLLAREKLQCNYVVFSTVVHHLALTWYYVLVFPRVSATRGGGGGGDFL